MKPQFREILYVFGVVAFAALTILSAFKIVDPNTAESVSAALTSVLGLFGVTVAGTAAYSVNKQIKKGAFDDVDPTDQVVNGINAVREQQQAAQDAAERLKIALSDAVKDVPVLGPLAQQAIKNLP